MSQPPAISILIVENRAGDSQLTAGVQALLPGCRLFPVDTGAAALHCLRRDWTDQDAPYPSLILLDLSLPSLHMDGFGLLAEVKSDPRLRSIPVIVFSASADEADVRRAYDLHANSFIATPSHPEDYAATVRSLERFWCRTALLPLAPGAGRARRG